MRGRQRERMGGRETERETLLELPRWCASPFLVSRAGPEVLT